MKTTAVVVLSLCITANAEACSIYKQPTMHESFSRASSVFRARVIEARLSQLVNPANPAEQVEVVEARYEVKEVFKGTPPSEGFVRDLPFGPGNCSLGVQPGMEYVFFPGEHNFVLIYSGTFGYFNAEGGDVKQQLEVLRKMGAVVTR